MSYAFKLPIKLKMSPPMQASKWLKCPVLLDVSEMQDLITCLGDIIIIQTSGIMPIDQEQIPHTEFLDCYADYIDHLKNGKISTDKRISVYFNAIFTYTTQALYAVHLDNKRQMVQVQEPVVQLQNHRFICGTDNKFHSMVFGADSIQWGLQFSFPQLYQSIDLQVCQLNKETNFPNVSLFKTLQKWVRNNTCATPFIVNKSETINVPVRLGKSCFSWINQHPQLAAAGLEVKM